MPPKKGKKGNDDDPIVFGKRTKYSWKKLVQTLQHEQTSQNTIREKIESSTPEYIRHSAEDRDGYLKGSGRIFKKETRMNAAIRFMEAQLRVEDFLFYQNEVNRWKRYGTDEPTRQQAEEARSLNKPPMLYSSYGDDARFEQFHREMLNHYDKHKIGAPQYRYRQGELKDKKTEASSGLWEILLEPEHLHLFTPAWRRVPAGLRQLSVVQDMGRAEEESIRIRVNEEAIENFRKRWDDARNETEGVDYNTHTERRAAELENYKNTRPSTANILVKPGKDGGQTDEDRFREIRTASGVFVSALESSHDWLTSYDCLGLVKNCSVPEYFETSAVREEDRFDGPPDEDEDLSAEFRPPSDAMDGEKGKERGTGDDSGGGLEDTLDEKPDENSCGARDSSIKAAKGEGGVTLSVRDGKATSIEAMARGVPEETDRKLRSGRTLSSSPTPKAKREPGTKKAAKAKKPVSRVGKKKGVASDPGTDKGPKKTTEGRSGKEVRATIDYPYNKQEFCLPKKTRKVSEDRLTTTWWAEATDGRRERHVGMVYKPCSPVNSPPHSPIDPDTVDMSTIPEGCRENDDSVTGEKSNLSDPKRRRCKHGNKNCRAWWTHATDEWSVHDEPTSLPTHRMEIDEPVMLNIPKNRRKKYHERLVDHYGRRTHGKATWPRLGIRVAYEPTTLAYVGGRGTKASLHGWRSLAMPVIEESLEPWNTDPDTIANVDASDNEGDPAGGDSDDENDLFKISYESSFPGGQTAPVLPLAIASGSIGPASVAPAAEVPAEDEQAGGDAEGK